MPKIATVVSRRVKDIIETIILIWKARKSLVFEPYLKIKVVSPNEESSEFSRTTLKSDDFALWETIQKWSK